MRVSIVEERGSYRLIRCSSRGYAVIESRGGRVYSMDGHGRRHFEDTESGMADVVGADGWRSRSAARARFEQIVQTNVRLAENLW